MELQYETVCQAILINKNLSDPSGQVKLKAKAEENMLVIESVRVFAFSVPKADVIWGSCGCVCVCRHPALLQRITKKCVHNVYVWNRLVKLLSVFSSSLVQLEGERKKKQTHRNIAHPLQRPHEKCEPQSLMRWTQLDSLEVPCFHLRAANSICVFFSS